MLPKLDAVDLKLNLVLWVRAGKWIGFLSSQDTPCHPFLGVSEYIWCVLLRAESKETHIVEARPAATLSWHPH